MAVGISNISDLGRVLWMGDIAWIATRGSHRMANQVIVCLYCNEDFLERYLYFYIRRYDHSVKLCDKPERCEENVSIYFVHLVME